VASLRPLDWRGTATALLLSALWGANPVAVQIGAMNVGIGLTVRPLDRCASAR